MRVVSGVCGTLLLVLTVGSILRNLVVPRGMNSILIRLLWRATRAGLNTLANPLRTYLARDRLLAWLGPVVLVSTLVWWLTALFVAYGLLLHAASHLGFGAAMREAGSSLLTLGFASAARGKLTAIDFLAAATGPLVIALQIAYLPTLYGAYNRRETEVTLLESRAGEPAWGPELIARQALVGTLDELKGLYENWERLAADIGESHTNYPILMTFRSPRPYRSWIIGLLAVLDGAALHLALTPTASAATSGRLMLRAGFTALRDIARVTGIPFNPDPSPDDPITLTYQEYADAVTRMVSAGLLIERPVEDAWHHFRGWRVNYEHIAYEIARMIDAVPALWSGERNWPVPQMAPKRPENRQPGSS